MSHPSCLPPCPDSPNCVSSQSQNPEQYIQPLSYTGTLVDAKAALLRIIEQQPRTRVVSQEDHYLHVETESMLFRFVDDIEFLFDEQQKLIHVRSASRTGYWDFGVNRKRVETLRSEFGKRSESP